MDRFISKVMFDVWLVCIFKKYPIQMMFNDIGQLDQR